MARAFARWAGNKHGIPAADVLTALQRVKPFVCAYFDAAASPDVAGFEFELFRVALADVMSGLDPDRDEGMASCIAD